MAWLCRYCNYVHILKFDHLNGTERVVICIYLCVLQTFTVQPKLFQAILISLILNYNHHILFRFWYGHFLEAICLHITKKKHFRYQESLSSTWFQLQMQMQMGEMLCGISKQLCYTNSFQYLKYNQFAIIFHGTISKTSDQMRSNARAFLIPFKLCCFTAGAFLYVFSQFSISFMCYFFLSLFDAIQHELIERFQCIQLSSLFEIICVSLCFNRMLWLVLSIMGAKSVVNSYQKLTTVSHLWRCKFQAKSVISSAQNDTIKKKTLYALRKFNKCGKWYLNSRYSLQFFYAFSFVSFFLSLALFHSVQVNLERNKEKKKIANEPEKNINKNKWIERCQARSTRSCCSGCAD